LTSARLALLFALGHTDEVHRELHGDTAAAAQDEEFFESWASQPAADDLPPQLSLHSTMRERYRTTVLGTEISISLDNTPSSVLLAEEFLGAFEGFFANLDYRESLFTTGQLAFQVRSSEFGPFPPDRSRSGFSWTFRVSADLRDKVANPAGVGTLRDWLFGTIMDVARAASIVRDVSALTRKIEQSGAVGRALFGTSVGDVPSSSEAELQSWTVGPEHELRRTQPWRRVANDSSATFPEITPGHGPIPESLKVLVRHKDYRVISVIDSPTWDVAKWRATGFSTEESSHLPPCLVIVFEDITAGRKIFEDWRATFGHSDEQERIRVAIIEGTRSDHGGYTVLMGPNYQREMGAFPRPNSDGWSRFVTITRFNEMNPAPGSPHLQRFKADLEKWGVYFLMPGTQRDGVITPATDVAIQKRAVVFRNAQDITEHDVDRVVLSKERKTERAASQVAKERGRTNAARSKTTTKVKKARKAAKVARNKGRR